MSIVAFRPAGLDHADATQTSSDAGHDSFLNLLPLIHRNAEYASRHLPFGDREEFEQDVIAGALPAYRTLVRQGRAKYATATNLARYSIAQHGAGRSIAHLMNINDASSKHCRRRKGIRVESLHRFDVRNRQWEEILVEDRQEGPADLAATRIDFEAWLDSLSPRIRAMAESLATGDHWTAAERLTDLVVRIGEMLAYQAFNIKKSPRRRGRHVGGPEPQSPSHGHTRPPAAGSDLRGSSLTLTSPDNGSAQSRHVSALTGSRAP